MKVQIFIEHDIIIRHFILTGVLPELEKSHDVQFVFADDPKRIKVDVLSFGLKNVIKVPVDRQRLSKLIDLAKVISMRQSAKKKYEFVQDLWKGILDKSHYRRLRVKSHPLILPFFKWFKLREVGENKSLLETIKNFSPDLIIHPSVLDGLFISDLCDLSKKTKIPLIVLMNSWDNPSVKAMTVGLPDFLAVWGEQTRQHAIEFMNANPLKVRILGAAQFEVYKSSPEVNRNKICEMIGIAPEKKIIVYAGSSKGINEMEHLVALEQACKDGELKDCHILFRPHPWRARAENEADYFSFGFKHVSIDPFMKPYFSATATDEIHLTSYMDTHVVLSACDLLISNVSTILLEAAMHGKPVICMVSDEDIAQSAFLKVVLNSLYFKELLERMQIPRCGQREMIATLIREKLNEVASDKTFHARTLKQSEFFAAKNELSYVEQLELLMKEAVSHHNRVR